MGAPLFNLPVRTNAQGALWLAVVGLSALTGGTQGPVQTLAGIAVRFTDTAALCVRVVPYVAP